MNLSRYITLNGGSGEVFSVGRVQSAVLSAVVSRHERAVNFVSSPYNEAEALIEDAGGISVKALLVHPGTQKTDFSLNDPYLVKAVAYAQSHSKEVTAEVTTVKKIRKPEKLFNLTALQKEAYKLCGYSPDESLTIAQALYEKHKCLSYPRTPSRVMGDNSVELFREKFNLLAGKYARWSRFSVPALIDRSNRHIFNSAALEDHHALIPLAYLPEGADSKEKNVFEIVVKQFFVACMGDYVWNEHRYEIKNGPYTYRAVTREPVEAGWKAVFERGKEGEDIPEAAGKLDTGSCYIRAVTVLDKKTSPPKLFRLDTLLAFMERPEAAEGGTGKPAGLGTPATRAEIIKNLFDKKYILEEKKQLIPTGKGEWLIRRLGSDKELSKMADAGETAEWERRLEEDPGSFEQSIIGYVKTSIKPGNGVQGFEKEPVGICPVCGNKVYEGRNGYFCSSRDNKNKPCQFSLWKIVAGARVTAGDAKQLLLNKSTGVKECVSKKTGKKFKACFHLNKAGEVEFIFRESTGKRKTKG
jgi:DNA topoisomerase-3